VVGDAMEYNQSLQRFMKHCEEIQIETFIASAATSLSLSSTSSLPIAAAGHDRVYHVSVEDSLVDRIHVQVDLDN
jgi:hypothetical protein